MTIRRRGERVGKGPGVLIMKGEGKYQVQARPEP